MQCLSQVSYGPDKRTDCPSKSCHLLLLSEAVYMLTICYFYFVLCFVNFNRPAGITASIGVNCNISATYRPVLRLLGGGADFAVDRNADLILTLAAYFFLLRDAI